MWGEEVWIVGGGRSADDFLNWRNLEGARVLAVNDRCFPASVIYGSCFFSVDNVWVRRNKSFLSQFREEAETYLALPQETWPDVAGIPGVKYLRPAFEDGLSIDPCVLRVGGNSGYGALNLAVLKGAKRINLIGFDMDPGDPVNGEFYRQWAPRFRTMLPQLKNLGVTVLNRSVDSHIDAFSKVGL